jgi:tRNA pseudouridine13 synthase
MELKPREAYPLLTESLTPVLGSFVAGPTTLSIDEIPLYVPSGDGEHTYAWVEIQGAPTQQIVADLSELSGVPKEDIGFSETKPVQALAKQFFSLPGDVTASLKDKSKAHFKVLDVNRHRNKLKAGHLLGNQFRIVIESKSVKAEKSAQAIMKRLQTEGLPNFFESDFFGEQGEDGKHGFDLLAKQERIANAEAKHQFEAFQALVFNQTLATRMEFEALNRVELGDVMQKVSSGGLFIVENREDEMKRYKTFETATTGPLLGYKMVEALGDQGRYERKLFEELKLDLPKFKALGKAAIGARRPLRVPVHMPMVQAIEGGVAITFMLPAGTHLSVLIDELVRPRAKKRSAKAKTSTPTKRVVKKKKST